MRRVTVKGPVRVSGQPTAASSGSGHASLTMQDRDPETYFSER